jgi:plastocyanin
LNGDFGPATGFSLADATSKFRVTFKTAGEYTFETNVREAANHENVVASAETTFIVAAAPVVAMGITYTSPEFIVGQQTEYTVTTTANDDLGKMVRAYFTLPAEATVEYFEVKDGNWYALGNEYGPSTGFPVSNATSRFRATYNAAGTFKTTVAFKKLDGTVVATKEIVATVAAAPVVAPTVTVKLPVGGFIVGVPTEFEISTVANGLAGLMVIGNSTHNFNDSIEKLEYWTGSAWYDLNGDFGPATGFSLADATSKFRVTFNTAGEYTFETNVREAANHENVVASVETTFTVADI